jgi:hypothetical protein
MVQPLFTFRETNLLNHNQGILQVVCGLIGIDPRVELTKDYIKEPLELSDYRKKFSPKNKLQVVEFPRYPQVFEHKYGFIPDLSILDVLFNLGPEVQRYLEKLTVDS